MNMLNYLRGKVTKIQQDSPSKKTKILSTSQQIYLEQINNYIEADGGYDILKEKLFKAINQFYMHDSPLVQEIVILLRKGLVSNKRQWQIRTITIIEDLLTNCSKIFNEAFNDKKFCQALVISATFLINLKAFDRKEIRQRISGIFLYWHIKFQTEPRYVYHEFYQTLKRCNVQFPSIPFIKQIKQTEIVIKVASGPEVKPIADKALSLDEIIKDCEQTGKQAEKLIKQNSAKIDTNYVRMLKAKNKKIYQISTSKQALSPEHKQKLSLIYKKLRTLLKEIDKKNEEVTKQKALQKEKQFLQQKLDGMTPKKTQKQGVDLSSSPIRSEKIIKKISSEHTRLQAPFNKPNQKNQLDLLDSVAPQIIKKESEPEQFVFDKNLLDIQTKEIKIQSPKKEQKKQEIIQPQMHTPQKKQKKQQYDQLLDYNVDYGSPTVSIDSEKKLNFKQLYAVNQLSPQLKDLDLLSPQKLKSKQSLKSDEQIQFGDYS